MSNLKETDENDLILIRKEETRNLRVHKKKLRKRNFLERYKKSTASPRKGKRRLYSSVYLKRSEKKFNEKIC